MRNPKRISRILSIIEKIWKENPDLRLLQLLLNATGDNFLYYLEDSELENALKYCYQTGNDEEEN